MRVERDHLRYMALMALEEIADGCRTGPCKKSLWLRFLLAWLFHESGANPSIKWVFTSFWMAATERHEEGREFVDNYCRVTSLQSSLNAITQALGWERTAGFMQEMRRRRGGD
jgi:hypothetical protein